MNKIANALVDDDEGEELANIEMIHEEEEKKLAEEAQTKKGKIIVDIEVLLLGYVLPVLTELVHHNTRCQS